jgi:hypothetical protein
MAIGQKPPMSFAIVNNLLAPNIRAIDLRIFQWATIVIAWNNSKNLKDGSSNMKHPERCSYTIPNIPPKDKCRTVVKAWANRILSKTKVCSG